MRQFETIIVGGGPAGASAALRLTQAGKEFAILDKAEFPRPKPCAGWITPKVFRLLGKTPDEYPYGILTFDKLYYDFGKFRIPIKTTQYSIRRIEFDKWLHEISGVKVIKHKVREIVRKNGTYIIDDAFTCKYLIGAGGTHCPVYHALFKQINPRAIENKIVAIEEEFPYEITDDRCLLWFGDLKLRGYSWYVPKPNGYLNTGLGGTFYGLKRNGENIESHWKKFTEKLAALGLVQNHEYDARGYSYFLRSNVKHVQSGNAFLAGDAAGLATLDMGEGIAPAIESGILAAEAIIYGKKYSLKKVSKFSFPSILFKEKFSSK